MAKNCSFRGKVVIVTGVASGIGLAEAKLFLAEGARVWGVDIQEAEQVKLLETKYEALFSFVQCDVREKTALATLTELVIKDSKRIDIVLNTAGILDAYQPSLETSEEEWDNVMATDLKSMFLLTNNCLPYMLEQKHGVFVNMASIAGLVAGGGGAAYTAAKHAIIGYTKQLDYDYAAQGIRANCIAPGAINTPMNQADFAGDGQMAKEVAAQTPALRWAQPEEVASLALFLASDGSDYIHGAVVPIDGGWIEK